MEPGAAAAGSRRVLRRLRDVMAGSGTAQQKLDTIVRIIAADMVAEVCSCYIRRAGDLLELFATEGLRPEAVHRTRLRVGEGLVGVIAATARPLALAEAQSHPDFAYRPETGEEVYHSLMGVPILRGGRVLGVLVVQNRTQRHYSEDEIEALQTIAMVLAEIAASGDLVSPAEQQPGEGNVTLPTRLEGIRLNTGLAIGQAVLHQPRVTIRRIVAEDVGAELERLRNAIAAMQSAIDELLAQTDIPDSGEHLDVLETYRMFAADRGWLQRIADAVRGGLTAEAAVQRVLDDTRARLLQATDPYIKERLTDLEDLANRLQSHLTGKPITAARASELPDEFVLIARNMGPAELLDYDRRRLKGLVLEEGSPGAHVAVVARALDIPVVGRVKDVLLRVEAGDVVVVDGDDAIVVLRPGEDLLQAAQARIRIRQGQREQYAAFKDLPAETKDGVRIELNLNAGLLIDLPYLDEAGAEGIGLFRTELQFMLREDFPTVAQQAMLYRRVLDQAGDRPVTFRTLDIGGDKLLPYMEGEREENPAMGWRAVRIALDRPALLRQQLRAFIRAATGRRLRVMFPLIAEIAEFEAAREVLELELARVRKRGGVLPTMIEAGVMLEVPSLLWELPELLKRVDFISVGTNDLVQFLFAADRGNARVAERYDYLSPAVLRVLADIARACAAAAKPFALCGEMAGDPLGAMALIGLGYRNLSMAPRSLGRVKAMVRSLDYRSLCDFLATLSGHTGSLRGSLHDFAQDHGVAI
ncbi:MAG: phosphoenolpyruvate--protein phosphotransferase [Alphaproteobacteria bacterium]|nr:phosphoenolpyruvate--protein phosphotransferase [Alphaproteobacteria bacterium]